MRHPEHKIDRAFGAWIFVAIVASFAWHELGHGLAGSALGYDMIVRLNSARPVVNHLREAWHADAIIGAGPAATILQAIIGCLLVYWAGWRWAFWIVFAALMMRVLGAAVSGLNPNDEAKVAMHFGLGYWTLHIAVLALLSALTLLAAARARPRLGSFGFALLFTALGMAFAVGIERRIPELILPAF